MFIIIIFGYITKQIGYITKYIGYYTRAFYRLQHAGLKNYHSPNVVWKNSSMRRLYSSGMTIDPPTCQAFSIRQN